MNVVFLAGLFPDNLRKEIEHNSRGVIQYAADALQWSFVKGLDYYYRTKIINLPYVGAYPNLYRKMYVSQCTFQHVNGASDISLGFLNIPIIKQYFRYINVKKELKRWGLRTRERKIIFIYAIHSPFIRAAVEIKKNYPEVKICLIIPDLPRYMTSKNTPVYMFLKAIDSIIIKTALSKIDYFVLLSDHMAEYLNITDKPWVRVEGIFNPLDDNIKSTSKEKNKTIFYSGTLDSRYGILNLFTAFSSIDDDDYRLWICGNGDCRSEIEKQVKYDKRIKYFGQRPREEVLLLQKKATVLVNPRMSEGDYTKYSFPSKTMEYLASGTPCIMHRLPGIPEEYYKYCIVAEKQSAKGLKEIILNVCSKSQSELDVIGHKAATFIRQHKNPKDQVRKIFNLINS